MDQHSYFNGTEPLEWSCWIKQYVHFFYFKKYCQITSQKVFCQPCMGISFPQIPTYSRYDLLLNFCTLMCEVSYFDFSITCIPLTRTKDECHFVHHPFGLAPLWNVNPLSILLWRVCLMVINVQSLLLIIDNGPFTISTIDFYILLPIFSPVMWFTCCGLIFLEFI